MGSGSGKKRKREQSVGFQFNAAVTAQTQTFINGDVNHLSIQPGLSVADLKKLDGLFQPLKEVVAQAAPADQRQKAEEHVQELHDELSKGQSASTERVNKIIDGLVELVPGALSAVVSMFASPILGALVGPVTKLILNRIQK